MNILVLTPIYPGPGIGQNFTKVVHYFTKEWVNMGENVQVVNLPSYFPKIMYHMPKWAVNLLQRKLSATIPVQRNSEICSFEVENVPVLRVPLYKHHPWCKVRPKKLEEAVNIIINRLAAINFVPDVIVAHWFDPQLYFVNVLKQNFGCKASMVVHNHTFKYKKYIDAPDLWGCRKIDTADVFKKLFPSVDISFRCKSGIPSSFLQGTPERSFNDVNNFVYIGTLIKRKYPDVVIDALSESSIKSSFRLHIIGEGGMKETLDRQVKILGVEMQTRFYGRINREDILPILDKSDVFVMISEDEVFGLVYIEAMARGLIVIASSNEGMEGIISNGENGFLVPAGNKEQLKKVIDHICLLSPEQRRNISKNAILTASSLTNEKVASEYLERIRALCYST